MPDAKQLLDQQFPEMRWRCLSLAADLDRIERAGGGHLLRTDPRMQILSEALTLLLEPGSDRAEKVQMRFSDRTPPPDRQLQIGNRQ